jgi:uncharacterized membrane protein YhaH (DUF805 family)
MSWYFQVLKKYAVFSGRTRRKEYWMFQLFNVLITIVLIAIDLKTGTSGRGVGIGLLTTLYFLAVFVPSLAVMVRRLHDIDHNGWWVLINLIPLFGPITILIFTVKDSQPGENQYGPNPKTDRAGGVAV